MEHIQTDQPSLASVALPFLLGVAAASLFAFVLQASTSLGTGARECLSTAQVSTDGVLANSGKTRTAVVTLALGTPVIAGQDRVRQGRATAVDSPVSYIRCMRKAS